MKKSNLKPLASVSLSVGAHNYLPVTEQLQPEQLLQACNYWYISLETQSISYKLASITSDNPTMMLPKVYSTFFLDQGVFIEPYVVLIASTLAGPVDQKHHQKHL